MKERETAVAVGTLSLTKEKKSCIHTTKKRRAEQSRAELKTKRRSCTAKLHS